MKKIPKQGNIEFTAYVIDRDTINVVLNKEQIIAIAAELSETDDDNHLSLIYTRDFVERMLEGMNKGAVCSPSKN